jgi:sarcosine oxidase, subunit delta
MKLLNCPINGLRPVEEFAYGGELRAQPDPQTCTDEEWADYVFHRNGAPGLKQECWYHVPSGTWFIAERNTTTDSVERTYLWGEA